MATVRFSLTGIAAKVFETETWLRIASECFGSRKVSKSISDEKETKWEVSLKKQQEEAHSLCHHAIHKLIPMAGAYQQKMLDTVSQASTVYMPEEAEAIYWEGSKMMEEMNGHISGILYNARKMREASRATNKMEDMHMKAVMYHNSVMPYLDTLRFHIDRLKEIMCIA